MHVLIMNLPTFVQVSTSQSCLARDTPFPPYPSCPPAHALQLGRPRMCARLRFCPLMMHNLLCTQHTHLDTYLPTRRDLSRILNILWSKFSLALNSKVLPQMSSNLHNCTLKTGLPGGSVIAASSLPMQDK